MPGCKFNVMSLQIVQEMTENYITAMFEDANLCTLHAKRVTVYKRDMQ